MGFQFLCLECSGKLLDTGAPRMNAGYFFPVSTRFLAFLIIMCRNATVSGLQLDASKQRESVPENCSLPENTE